jgi:hypothetical protein
LVRAAILFLTSQGKVVAFVIAPAIFRCGDAMKRRDFITIFGGASATLPFAAKAQEAQTYRLGTRLGVLLPLPRDAPVNVAFMEEFRHHGFIEGQNLIVEWRAYGLH